MNITYEDKVALIENEDIPDINKCNASDMNQIKEVVNSKANVIKLLTVSDEAPASCETGDKYYNTADEVIYTAIGTDEWGTDGEEPVQGYVYLDVENSKLYCYDGTTFSSYGGGTPSEVVISEEEPEATEEHKIWIPTGETGNMISEVVDNLAGNESNLAPSVRAVKQDIKGVIGNASSTNDGLMTSNFVNLNRCQSILIGNNEKTIIDTENYSSFIIYGTYNSGSLFWVINTTTNSVTTTFSQGTKPTNWTFANKKLTIPATPNTRIYVLGTIYSFTKE